MCFDRRLDSPPSDHFSTISDIDFTELTSVSISNSITENSHVSVDHTEKTDAASADLTNMTALTNESSNLTSVQTFDCRTSGNLESAFMDVPKIIRVLAENETPLDYIPEGVKENIYFVIKNEKNTENRFHKQKSYFHDDCGVWNSACGTTPKTAYLVLPNGEMKKIVWKKDAYCYERKVKGKYEYVPLHPQPADNELLLLHRYYTSLKLDKNYKKRVSWLSHGGNEKIALVEYIGKYPGLAPHGNAKQKAEYVRTPHYIMLEMGELLKNTKPQNVYDKLRIKYDEFWGPEDPQQIYNKKKHDLLKERKEKGLTYNRSNVADHIKEIEKQVTGNHPFIRSVVRQSGKAPCIILYSDEQITDIKHLCCTGQTVLGVDKTFNLCDMHVTVSCYKQLAVTRSGMSEPPLFFGPMFIHDNSDFESYSIFFSHLQIKLAGVDTSKLVFGSDDEKAMVNAITSSFSNSKHILCTRHLRQNVNQKLTDAAVDKSDLNMLLNKIFGDDGIINADDTVCFEEKCEEIESISQSISQPFLRYFQKRVKDNLDKKRKEPENITNAEKQWTNNNCESLNHILKQKNDWKSKPLLEFIQSVQELVDVQFKDLRRSLIGTGRFKLADTHKHFGRFIRRDDLDKLEKQELVELYHKYIIPLPQRKYRQNRRGRQMTKQQILLAKKRKHSTEDDNSEPPQKKQTSAGGLLTSFEHLKIPSGDRLKPPPSCVNFEKKTVKLSSSSSSSSSPQLSSNLKKLSLSKTKTSESRAESPEKKVKLNAISIKGTDSNLKTNTIKLINKQMERHGEKSEKTGKESQTQSEEKSQNKSTQEVEKKADVSAEPVPKEPKKIKITRISWP